MYMYNVKLFLGIAKKITVPRTGDLVAGDAFLAWVFFSLEKKRSMFFSAGRALYFILPICFSSHEFFTYRSRFFVSHISCWANIWKHLLLYHSLLSLKLLSGVHCQEV